MLHCHKGTGGNTAVSSTVKQNSLEIPKLFAWQGGGHFLARQWDPRAKHPRSPQLPFKSAAPVSWNAPALLLTMRPRLQVHPKSLSILQALQAKGDRNFAC